MELVGWQQAWTIVKWVTGKASLQTLPLCWKAVFSCSTKGNEILH